MRAGGERLAVRPVAEDRQRCAEAVGAHACEGVEEEIEALLRPEAPCRHDVGARSPVRPLAAPRLLPDARHVDGIVDADHLPRTRADAGGDLAHRAVGLGDDPVGGAHPPQVAAVEEVPVAAVLEIDLPDHLADDEPGRREQWTDQEEREVHVALRRGDDRGSELPDRAHQRGERTAEPRRAERMHGHVGRHLAEIGPDRVGQHQMGLEAPPVEVAQHRHHDALGPAAVEAGKREQDARRHEASPARAAPPAARRCGRGRSARGRRRVLRLRAGGRVPGRGGCGRARR